MLKTNQIQKNMKLTNKKYYVFWFLIFKSFKPNFCFYLHKKNILPREKSNFSLDYLEKNINPSLPENRLEFCFLEVVKGNIGLLSR